MIRPMELAIILASSSVLALTVLIVQGRPSRRKRYREDRDWEIDVYVARPLSVQRRRQAAHTDTTVSDAGAQSPEPRAPARAVRRGGTLVGARALSVSNATTQFWAALAEDGPQTE